MPIRAACPNPECRRSYTLADGLATPHARCPACRTVLTYPDTAAAHNETVAAPAVEELPDPLPTAPTEVGPAPQRVGRFVVLGKLGSGAFGTVYKARDPQLERDVALKVPNPGMLDTPKRVERFLREAKAAARLRHPHIVPVFDAGQDGDRYYIASAFVDGKPLSDAIDGDGLEFERAAEVVRLLAEAIGYAHEQGVVHRDIKPHNVMLDAADRPHLMDFGLAARSDEAEKLTSDGAVMGTPAYMAPEQAAGQKGEASPLSDQYSLGVLLYELLTGQTPFSGPPAAVIYRVIHHDPPAPRALNPDVPPDLETICLKAMAKRPTDRYPMCRMFAADLRLWLVGEPITARRQTTVEKAVRWVKRNRAVAALMLVAFVSLVGGAAVATAFGLQAQTRARDAEVARDEVREAERRAAEAFGALDGAQDKGKNLAERIGAYDKERQDRTAEVGRLQEENGRLRETTTRLREDNGELRGRLDELDGALPPPREVDSERRRQLADLRDELARKTAAANRIRDRLTSNRPIVYQQVPALLEGSPANIETATALLQSIPPDQRGWEWNYLSGRLRSRSFTNRQLFVPPKTGSLSAPQITADGSSFRVSALLVEGLAPKHKVTLYRTTINVDPSDPMYRATFALPMPEHLYTSGLWREVSSCRFSLSGRDEVSVVYTCQRKDAIPGERVVGERQYELVTYYRLAFITRILGERSLLKGVQFSPHASHVAFLELNELWAPKPGVSWVKEGMSNSGKRSPAKPEYATVNEERPVIAAVADDGGFLATDAGTVFSLPADQPVGQRVAQPVAQFSFASDAPLVFSPKSAWIATTQPLKPGNPLVKVVCTPVRNPADAPREFVGHTGKVRAITFSADETRMITGGDDGTVQVWDTETTECLLTLKAGGTVTQLAMSPPPRERAGQQWRIVALVENPKDPKLFHVREWYARDMPAKKP